MGEYVPITYVEDTIPHVWWIVSSIEIFLGTCIEYRTGELAGIERIVSSRKTARSISLRVTVVPKVYLGWKSFLKIGLMTKIPTLA